jgi:hypothetical protein
MKPKTYEVPWIIVFIICTLSIVGLIMLCWAGYEVWSVIAGTGEHEVKMIWRGR